MVTIPLSGGPPKRRIIEMAYAKCGLAGYELGRTPEEVNDAQSELNAMMLEWPFCCLGYEQPDYGLGHPDDCSGIPAETLAAVATQLALRLAPNMGKTLSPEAHGAVSRSMSLLYAKTATVPTQPLQSNTPRGMGRNRGVSFSNPFINEDYASPGGCLPIVPALRGIIKRGGGSSSPVPPPPASPTLLALALSANSILENSVAGTIVGAIQNATAGSTLSLGDNAGGRFAISGGNLVAGAVSTDYESATSHSITIVETLIGAVGSPKSTTFTITVGNVFEQASLGALSFSATTFLTTAPASGTIIGATPGSVITATSLPAGLTINDAARTWAWDGTGSAGAASFTLTETLPDSANSPRLSAINYTIVAAPGTLQVLTLSSSSIAENSVAGTVVGAVQNVTAGSALTLSDTAGSRFAVSGGNIVAGATATNYESATTHNITIVETLTGATGSPKSTTLAIAVTNVFEQPNLAALTLSASTFATGASASGTILGATATSTITVSGLPTGLTINGAARTWAWDGTGSVGSGTFTLTETLSDSANSPRTNTISYTISAAPSAPTLVLTSGTTDPPLITRTLDGSVGEGDYVQRQIDTVNTFNSGNYRFEERILQWTGTAFQLADPVTFAPSPFTIQTGLAAATNYYLQERIRRFQGDTNLYSTWANLDVYPFQLASTVNAYWTTTGLNKNHLVTVSGADNLTVSGLAGNGTNGQAVRSKLAQTSDYSQVEVTLPASGTASFYCGYDDGTMDLNASVASPGGQSNTGVQFSFFSAGSNVYFVWNSGGSNALIATGAGTWAAGDIWTFRYKISTNTYQVWRTRGVTTTLMITKVGGIPVLSHLYWYVAHNDSPVSHTNFGATTYAKAIDAGCAATFSG